MRGMNEGILTSEVIPSGRENYRAADGPDRRMETSTEDSSGGSLSDLSISTPEDGIQTALESVKLALYCIQGLALGAMILPREHQAMEQVRTLHSVWNFFFWLAALLSGTALLPQLSMEFFFSGCRFTPGRIQRQLMLLRGCAYGSSLLICAGLFVYAWAYFDVGYDG